MKLFNSSGFPYTALVTSALAIVMIVGLSPVPAQTATPSNTQPQQQQLVAAMEAQRAALVVASSQSAACKWTTSLGADAMLIHGEWLNFAVAAITKADPAPRVKPLAQACGSETDKQSIALMQRVTFEWLARTMAMRRLAVQPGWANQIIAFDFQAAAGEALWKRYEAAMAPVFGQQQIAAFYQELERDTPAEAAVMCPVRATMNTKTPRACPSIAQLSQLQRSLAIAKFKLIERFGGHVRAALAPTPAPVAAAAAPASPPSGMRQPSAAPSGTQAPTTTAPVAAGGTGPVAAAKAGALCSSVRKLAEAAAESPTFGSVSRAPAKKQVEDGIVGTHIPAGYDHCRVSRFAAERIDDTYSCRVYADPAKMPATAVKALSDGIVAQVTTCLGVQPTTPTSMHTKGYGHLIWSFPGKPRVQVHKVDGSGHSWTSLIVSIQYAPPPSGVSAKK